MMPLEGMDQFLVLRLVGTEGTQSCLPAQAGFGIGAGLWATL